MDGYESENLKELLERFLDPGQVEGCLDDFRETEGLLRRYPAPEPDDMLIANIKAEIAMRLPVVRVHTFKHRLREMVGIAAAIAVLAVVGVRLSHTPGRQMGYHASLIPTAIWESTDIATDDADLALFTTEIEQIKDEVLVLESGEHPTDNDGTIIELETELAEINSDFWKG